MSAPTVDVLVLVNEFDGRFHLLQAVDFAQEIIVPENEMSELEELKENIKRQLGAYKKKSGKYTAVVPLSDFYEEPTRIEWLRTQGLEVPLQRPAGRNPTPQEVRYILRTEFFYVSYAMPLGGQWTATVRGRKTVPQTYTRHQLMRVYGRDYTTEDKPVTLGFGGDYEFVKLFLEKLAVHCGPFVLVMTGDHPEIIGLGSHQLSEDEA